jgi:starvation-inducible DNA-binding protein
MNKQLFEKLNKHLADTGVMYIKLHNLHWNVAGTQFKAVHEYLEALYDSFTENMDEIAELMRMHGEYPAASMVDFLNITSIKELGSEKFEVKKALSIVLDDLKALNKEAVEIRSMADEDDVFDVVAMMEDLSGFYQKTIWFISSTLE